MQQKTRRNADEGQISMEHSKEVRQDQLRKINLQIHRANNVTQEQRII